MSGKRPFSFSCGISKTAGAGAGMRASKTVLKIFYKSSLEYLGTFIAATGVTTTGGFVFKGLVGCSDNPSPNLRGGQELEGATKGATKRLMEGAMEGCSW